ncbi:hypothetical protein HDU76_013488 [Blyttiomyces sp. JEL0837]|nr:hypothetical protein HDU76_013488 [Blyttiomyces sp. JEL0837]
MFLSGSHPSFPNFHGIIPVKRENPQHKYDLERQSILSFSKINVIETIARDSYSPGQAVSYLVSHLQSVVQCESLCGCPCCKPNERYPKRPIKGRWPSKLDDSTALFRKFSGFNKEGPSLRGYYYRPTSAQVTTYPPPAQKNSKDASAAELGRALAGPLSILNKNNAGPKKRVLLEIEEFESKKIRKRLLSDATENEHSQEHHGHTTSQAPGVYSQHLEEAHVPSSELSLALSYCTKLPWTILESRIASASNQDRRLARPWVRNELPPPGGLQDYQNFWIHKFMYFTLELEEKFKSLPKISRLPYADLSSEMDEFFDDWIDPSPSPNSDLSSEMDESQALPRARPTAQLLIKNR